MDGLQITFGGGVPAYQALLTALMPAVVAAGAALLGVWLTNNTLAKHKKADDQARRLEREAVEKAVQDREDRDRTLTALEFVAHLESYALDCANRLTETNDIDWDADYVLRSLAPFPTWPEIIDWRLLGPKHAAYARNFSMRVRLITLGLDQTWEDGDPVDFTGEVGNESAILGWDAWITAAALRSYFDLEPFRFDDRAWNFVELLQTSATDVQRRRQEWAERMAAMQAKRAAKDV